nr:immunoglobulin light chain junction region [Macaca mulatta]MOX77514.1 immunoglobulin light chain junction region [Macaca mulatta]MOX77526.1 immunoglobulin light chain junction region [Macaca mulatta]MOX77542.1 immunoglobulin light chain junction region [Macaca mulatta]MOX77700.1 immunoglobulin light chain junction region [Macaca mulatta]
DYYCAMWHSSASAFF